MISACCIAALSGCELLEDHRAEVVRVAERLVEKGEIDAAEFMHLMGGAA
jgi:ATP-dependent Zn protease